MVDLQCRSMKYNGLSGEGRDEDTRSKLRDLLNIELGIKWNIEFGNVPRFGNSEKGNTDPLLPDFCMKMTVSRFETMHLD